MMPSPTKVPTTKSYPHNLFTWLGGRYRFEVQEPITQLCPERLCDANRAPLPMRMAGMTLDSSVVYLTVALPAGLAHAPAAAHRELEGLHPGPALAAPVDQPSETRIGVRCRAI